MRLARIALIALIAPLLGAAPDALAQAAAPSSSAAPQKHRPPPPKAFQGPRETWQRLGLAVRRGDKEAALQELTPNARERYEAVIDAMIAARPFSYARFGTVKAVTLTDNRFATLRLKRKKLDGVYGTEVMLMRGEDGRWHIDKMS